MIFNAHTHIQTDGTVAIVNAEGRSDLPQYYSLGVHPWNADTGVNDELKNQLKASACLAIGEAGLDKLKGPDLTIQTACFIKQIKWSEELGLPLIIHCVKAWNEVQALKRQINPKQTWIYHGFSKASLIDEVLKEGVMISLGAAILTHEKLQHALLKIPENQLLLETDDSNCPIQEIYQKVSELKNIPLSRLEEQIEYNFKRVFTKWKIG